MSATSSFKNIGVIVIRLLSTVLILLFIYSTSFAYEMAALESETAEDLLLFFEEAELIIATRHATPVRKAPAIATVITAKEIRNMGARNLFDILRRVPGIGISIADVPVLQSIEVRGIKTTLSEKVLLMIDGHRVNSPHSGSSAWNNEDLPADIIKQVEIIRGPGSALYGTNAFIVVINVVTKDTSDIAGLQVTAGAGSFDTQHYNLLFGHENRKLKIAASFDYLNTDGPSSVIDQDTIGASGNTLEWKENTNLGLNITYEDIAMRARYSKTRKGPYLGIAYALNDESIQDDQQMYIDMIYSKDITDKASISAKLYGDYLDMEKYWEIFPEGFVSAYPEGMLGSPSGKNSVVGAETAATYTFNNHILTGGAMYEKIKLYNTKRRANFNPLTNAPLGSYQDITSWANYTQNSDREVWAIYTQDVWNITDTASLTAGLRYDHYSDFNGTTNPRVGFVWELLTGTSMKLLYGSAFRAPSFNELYYINNPVSVGNPDLKPEKIKTYEAGLEHRFLENYTLRLNYFFNDLEDLIALGEKPSATEPAVWENRGSAEVDGIEAELLFDFGNDNYGYINYSYQHPVNTDTGERLPDVPSQRANAVINIAPWDYLNANISINWTGKRYRADSDTREDLPSNTLVDLTLIGKKLYKTLEIRGSIYNLFDEHYLDPSPVPVKVPNDYPTNRRMFLAEARYTF